MESGQFPNCQLNPSALGSRRELVANSVRRRDSTRLESASAVYTGHKNKQRNSHMGTNNNCSARVVHKNEATKIHTFIKY